MTIEPRGRSSAPPKTGPLSELDVLNLAYVALVLVVILVGWGRIRHGGLCLAVYATAGVGLIAFLRVTARATHPFVVLLRAWYSPLLFILHYEFTFHVNQSLAPLYAPWFGRFVHEGSLVAGQLGHRVYFDPILMAWDQWLFGFQPSVRFAAAWGTAWIGELMHFAYFSFYLFIPLLGFTLLFQRRRQAFDDFVFRATFTMLLCCAIFIPFPIAGPRHYLAPDALRLNGGYVFAWIVRLLFDYCDVPTGGFPSSHVAVAASALISAFVYEKRVFLILAALFVGLCLATIYVAGHYVVDTLGGLLVAPLSYALAGPVRDLLGRPLAHLLNGRPHKWPEDGETIGA